MSQSAKVYKFNPSPSPEEVAEFHSDKIKAFYESSVKLSEEIGIDQKQAFWAHVTMYAIPEFPTDLSCEAHVYCDGSR